MEWQDNYPSRSSNAILGILLSSILNSQIPSNGWALVLFPPSYFFHFLFYTDTASTLLVLSSLVLAKQKRYHVAGLVGLASLTIRQTNAVWMAFIAGTSLLDIFDDPALLRPLSTISISTIFSTLAEFIKQCIFKIRLAITLLWSFILLLAFFVGFVVWNGSITLGDKDNHKASLHFPQLFYFSAFTCFFGLFSLGPVRLTKTIIPSILTKNWLSMAILTPMIYLAVQKFTIAHPFLLADNRHFTFYIWRYILRHDIIRAALSPAYAICIIVIAKTLSHKPFLWNAIYMLALCLTLIPSPLIEFRYFIIPYYIWRLNMKVPFTDVSPCSVGEMLWYSAINVVVFTLFWGYPFEWISEPGVNQRFMW